ncbi:MAG: TRAP transporter substrate-binding protein [Pararhodobacter sp.]
MNTFTKFRAFGAAAAIATAFAAPAAAEELRFAHFVAPGHTLTASTIEPLQEAIADAGLTVRVYPGGELGAGPLEQYVRVLQGVADIVWGLQGYNSSQFQRTMISELPGALNEGQSGYDAIWNAYDAGQLANEFPGTVPLALWTSEPNVIIMRGRTIRTPADLAGLKIRVSGSAAGSVVEALGATPVQMPAGEMYNALQTGLIDGIITGSSAIGDFRLDEVADSYTFGAPLGHISFYVVMNQARYQGLSEEHRAAIDSIAGRELSASAEDGWNARALSVIEEITNVGNNTIVDLTEEEIAAFAAITLPVRDQVIATVDGGDEVLATMQGN